MNTEALRKTLSQFPMKKQFYSESQLATFLNTAVKVVKKGKNANFGSTEAHRWFHENFDFVLSVSKSIPVKRCHFQRVFADYLLQAVLSEAFSGSKEDVQSILSEGEKNIRFKEVELERLREAFIISLLRAIAYAVTEDHSLIPRLIRALHQINGLDFHRIALSFSPLERILRSDPAGIYSKMTAETRSQYREKIKMEAACKKTSCEAFAKTILDRAIKDKQHIGFYLKEKNHTLFYFLPILTLSIAFSILPFLCTGSFWFTALVFPLVYFFIKSIADHLLSKIIKTDAIPSVRCDYVREDEKTCVVIASLICNENDVHRLLSKLKQYCYNNKDERDELYFGLLCDLPQHNEIKSASDENLIACLKSEIERLSVQDPSFFAMIRSRVFHKSENAYVGWERKRGAIHEFVEYLQNGILPSTYCFFGSQKIIGSKYLICLDGDTELGIGQAKRLLGRMIHPLNKPIISIRKDGTQYVKAGYGILQPRVAPSLLNPISTPYAKIYSNGSGCIPYAAANYDTMQSLFGVGNFCGKGIIDVSAYSTVLKDVIPEQKILSHDMPEGALLRCGSVLDEYLLDSDPQDAISNDKRLHRWIRGDVQNAVLYRVLPRRRVIFALENLFSYFIPIAQLAILLYSAFSSRKIALFGCSIVILYEFLPLIRESFAFLSGGNFQILGRRFQSRMRNRLLNSFYQCALSLSGICHRAYNNSDAILRSVYRLLFSKKKLLEWQTYSPFSANKKDPLLFYLPSILGALFLLFISHTPLLLLLSLAFVFYPFIMLALSQPYVETDVLTNKEKSLMLEMAKNEFLFFTNVVNEKSSFLPPDNIQFEPVEKIANRTSPTNIGLYLASLVSAVDLGLISVQECLKSIEKAMDSIEKMEHYQGHLFNWYDLSTLGVIGDRFVSTVDSGNYVASLIVVASALKEWNGYEEAARLYKRVEEEIASANFKVLFDHEQNLFYVGIFPDDKDKPLSHYDLYMSEARITSFYAIASRQIQASHWYTTQRPVLSFLGRVGVGSWTGTCFEYFMPTLYLPIVDNSLEDESLNFAWFCQNRFYCSTEFGNLWGISESGHSQVDDAGNLQYMAFGVPFLSVQENRSNHKVFSSYSSFLMLQKAGKEALKNLGILEKLGAYGPMGFFEAVEFNSNFINDYTVIKSYMAHHKGMSFLSLANALCDSKNVERFMSRSGFKEVRELLAERFPIEGKIYRKKREPIAVPKKGSYSNDVTYPTKEKVSLGKLLTDGKCTVIGYDNGENRLIYHSKDVFKPCRGGIRCRIQSENEVISFQNSEQRNVKMRYTALGIEYIWVSGKKSAILSLSPIFGRDGFFLRFELNGFPQSCRVEIGFDPLLLDEREYDAHPAFRDLSLEAFSDGSNLTVRRRGLKKHDTMRISSPSKFKTKIGEGVEGYSFEKRMIFHCGVEMIFDFPSGENCLIPILFNLSQSANDSFESCFDGAYHLTKDLCKQGESKFNRLNEICGSTKGSEKLLEKILAQKNSQRHYFIRRGPVKVDFLWKNGVSGDWPILAFHPDSLDKKVIKKAGEIVSAYKKLMLSGVLKYDLVILRRKGEGYFDPEGDALSDLIREYRCNFLIGKHPGIHVISCDFEELLVWQSVATCFLSDNYALPKSVPEKEFWIRRKRFENNKAERVGRMLKNGFEINKSVYEPSVPFSHVVSNGRIGFVCNQNSLGYTWYRNAGLNRISKWDNLPNWDDGEKIYLEIEDEDYDLLQIANSVTYYDSFVLYKGKVLDNEYSVIASIPDKLSVKIVSVIFAESFIKKSKLYYSFVPCVGRLCDRNILLEVKNNFALLQPAFYSDYSDCGFVFTNGPALSVLKKGERLFFESDCTCENVFALGGISGEKHFNYLKSYLNHHLEEMIYECNRKSSMEKTDSPLKFWLKYQVLHSRFLGRTGLYQSSGAFGFRDQLQDSLVFLEDEPEKTKIHLIRCAAHQFREGDVLHWWHPIRDKNRWDPGIRSRCSDDYLWLLYVADAYIKKTKNSAILDVPIPFLLGDLLKEDENEKYISVQRGESGTMLEHLEKAAKLLISRGLGEHNLPWIGCGDWNDGMNEVDGESVWLAFFGAICLSRIKKYVSEDLRDEIDIFLSRLNEGIQASFNGVWFCRAFRKNGQVLGNDVTLESECSIDLITQAFSAFYFTEFYGTKNSLDEKKVAGALRSAFDVLVDQDHRTVKLFYKPFENITPPVGYIQKYCAGVRENGGQYTHAAVWYGMALLEFSKKTNDPVFFQMAKEIKEFLDPMQNLSFDLFQNYQREPYVLCGDVYDAKGYQGHGGWSWYTGAAGWYLQFLKSFDDLQKRKKNVSGIT